MPNRSAIPGMVRQRARRQHRVGHGLFGPERNCYQAFTEAPYKDEFDEWLARIVCYAFSLPPTAFIRQVNRATAETRRKPRSPKDWLRCRLGQAAPDQSSSTDGQSPGPRIRLARSRPIQPARTVEGARPYVRAGIYTVNEARDILGFGAIAGGEQARVYGNAGPVPLAEPRPTGPNQNSPTSRILGRRQPSRHPASVAFLGAGQARAIGSRSRSAPLSVIPDNLTETPHDGIGMPLAGGFFRGRGYGSQPDPRRRRTHPGNGAHAAMRPKSAILGSRYTLQGGQRRRRHNIANNDVLAMIQAGCGFVGGVGSGDVTGPVSASNGSGLPSMAPAAKYSRMAARHCRVE